MKDFQAFRISCLAATLGLVAAQLPAQQTEIGVTAAVNRDATLERAARQRAVILGDDVALADRIVTSSDGLVQVLFVDGSTFTVGAGSQVVIDRFVYDPATGSGELVSQVTRGALRFVGGQLSKGSSPVRFGTPVGILGARGAIVDIDLEPGCLPSGECPVMTANLVFGEELTLTGDDGQIGRIYEPGNAFAVFADGAERSVRVVRAETLGAGSLQARLSGDADQSGGADDAPDDDDVERSGLPGGNSNNAPGTVQQRGREIVGTDVAEEDETDGGFALDDQTGTDLVRDEIIDQIPDTPPDPARRTLQGVFGTPDTYTTSRGVVISTPEQLGVFEEAPESFVTVDIVEDAAGLPTAIEFDGASVAIPAGEGEFDLGTIDLPDVGQQVTGTYLGGPGGFGLFYFAQEDSGTTPLPVSSSRAALAISPAQRGLFVLLGTPTPRDVFYPGANTRPAEVRSYAFGPDLALRARGIDNSIPLLSPVASAQLSESLLSATVMTPFYVIERTDISFNARTMYAALGIEGQGRQQSSMIVSDAGLLYSATAGGEDSLGIGGSRRGSYRLGAFQPSVFMRGSTGNLSIGDPDLKTGIAGANGGAFVYTSGIDAGLSRNTDEKEFLDLSLVDPLRDPGQVLQYSSGTVPAFLDTQTALADFNRPDGRLFGFAAGMTENETGAVIPFRSAAVGGFDIEFDPAIASVGGFVRVSDVTNASNVAGFSYAFGYDTTFEFENASSSRSAYLDRDRFVANSTGPDNSQGGQTTTLTTDGFELVTHKLADPGTYIVSSGLVPQPGLFQGAGVTPCDCAFMQWGWWGTQTEFESTVLPNGRQRDFVHLGTWVAGDIPDFDELPTFGTGHYDGHAIGTVVSQGGVADAAAATASQYVAVGDLTMTYDFAAGAGLLEVGNFDGNDFAGSMFGSSAAEGMNQFEGSLSGAGIEGSATGAFARGPDSPVQGVLGDFNLTGEGFSATGTFMGAGGLISEGI